MDPPGPHFPPILALVFFILSFSVLSYSLEIDHSVKIQNLYVSTKSEGAIQPRIEHVRPEVAAALDWRKTSGFPQLQDDTCGELPDGLYGTAFNEEPCRAFILCEKGRLVAQDACPPSFSFSTRTRSCVQSGTRTPKESDCFPLKNPQNFSRSAIATKKDSNKQDIISSSHRLLVEGLASGKPPPPRTGRHPPGVGRHPPRTGRHPPGVGRHPPRTGRHPPGVGRHRPRRGRHPVGVGRHPPGVGHHPPRKNPPPSRFPPFPPYPPAAPSPPFIVLAKCCDGKGSGIFADVYSSPPCSYYCTCKSGEQVGHGRCEGGLLYDDDQGACHIPDLVLCKVPGARPPPPPPLSTSNFTTGLDLNIEANEERFLTIKKRSSQFRYDSVDHLPVTVDWSHLFNGVRDQGACNGTWAYSSVDAIQAALLIALGLDKSAYKGPNLEVEEILACSGKLSSCKGGWPEDALEYAANAGFLSTQGTFDGRCGAASQTGVFGSRKIIGWERVPAQDPLSLKRAVASQPVIVGISTQGGLREWKSNDKYSGRYNGQNCSLDLVNHNLLIVGYGNGYWLARNSWGSNWGNRGYINISRTQVLDDGVCNMLALSPVYPVVNPLASSILGSSAGNRKLLAGPSTPSPLVPGEVNLALRKPAFESSTLNCSYYTSGCEAKYAVDGNNGNGTFSSGSCSHTDDNPSSTVWWKVDLQREATVRRVLLYSRGEGFANRLDGVTVWIGSSNVSFNAAGNTECDPANVFKYSDTNTGFPIYKNCTLRGRFVWVYLPGESPLLTLCEVEVFGAFIESPPPPRPPPSPTRPPASPPPASRLFGRNGCPVGALTLCGGGDCSMRSQPALGQFPIACQCPPGYINVVTSIGLPSCALVDVCNRKSSNPCNIGECVNDGVGGYRCVCPDGWTTDVTADNSTTCVSPSRYEINALSNIYVVPQGWTCAMAAEANSLSFLTFFFLNPGINCGNIGGEAVVVGPVADTSSTRCASVYQLGSKALPSCQDVRNLFGLDNATFAFLNPAVCPTPATCLCAPQTTVCLEYGFRSAVGYPCSSYNLLRKRDTCSDAIARSGLSALSFFRLNPGLNCDKLVFGTEVCSQSFLPSLPALPPSSSRSLLGARCPCVYGCFAVRAGDTCQHLAVSIYHCSLKILQYWNGRAFRGFVCKNRNLFPGKTILCKPKRSGSCRR